MHGHAKTEKRKWNRCAETCRGFDRVGEKGVSGAVDIAAFLCLYPISLAWTRLDRRVCGILEYVSRFVRNYSPRRNDHLLKQTTSGADDKCTRWTTMYVARLLHLGKNVCTFCWLYCHTTRTHLGCVREAAFHHPQKPLRLFRGCGSHRGSRFRANHLREGRRP